MTSSEKLGLTRFVFESVYHWKNEKMFDDVPQISKQLKCPVLTVYTAGPDENTQLILPPPDDTSECIILHNPAAITDQLLSLKDVFAMRADQWDEFTSYVVTDAFDESFKPVTQLIQGKTD